MPPATLLALLLALPPPLDHARALLDAGKTAEALAAIDQALAASQNPELRFEAGRMLRQLAERRFADLERVAPDSAPVHELAGRHFELRGKLAEALKEYRAALAKEPRRPGVRYKAGNILWAQREFEAAEVELRGELESNPGHGMANLRLGQTLAARSQDAQAVGHFERAIAAMPASVETHREAGKSCRKLGRNDEARRHWELVAKLRPRDDQVHFLLANLYRQLGQTAAAAREFETHRVILEQRRALAEKR